MCVCVYVCVKKGKAWGKGIEIKFSKIKQNQILSGENQLIIFTIVQLTNLIPNKILILQNNNNGDTNGSLNLTQMTRTSDR